jgi:hypothetical protein
MLAKCATSELHSAPEAWLLAHPWVGERHGPFMGGLRCCSLGCIGPSLGYIDLSLVVFAHPLAVLTCPWTALL